MYYASLLAVFAMFCVIALIINIIMASAFQSVARMKGHQSTKYFWFTFLFGIVGMLLVVALPDRGANQQGYYGMRN